LWCGRARTRHVIYALAWCITSCGFYSVYVSERDLQTYMMISSIVVV